MNFFNQLSPHQWEYFASYYFGSLGYTILEWPSVGQDDGKDLIIELDGVKSLVSCKHYARSRNAVYPRDECSALDKVVQHGAQQFIGFYSTKASQDLLDYLAASSMKYLLFEGEAIFETMTEVSFSVHQSLFRSIQPIKRKVFGQAYRPLFCKCGCGKDILDAEHAVDSTVFLSSERGELELIWLINDHGYKGYVKPVSARVTKDLFMLTTLNEAMDEHEEIMKGASSISPELSRDYCLVLETIQQMVYPAD